MYRSFLYDLDFLHLLHSINFIGCLFSYFPNFTEPSLPNYKIQFKTIQFNYPLYLSTFSLQLVSMILIDGASLSPIHICFWIFFKFFTQFYASQSIIIYMSKYQIKYKKFPICIFLFLSLEELVLLNEVFLVCRADYILISESLVVRISWPILLNFNSKVNYLGFIIMLVSIYLLSNRRGD